MQRTKRRLFLPVNTPESVTASECFGAECLWGLEFDAAPLEQKGLSYPGGGGDDTLSQHCSSGARGDEKSKTYGNRGDCVTTGCWG